LARAGGRDPYCPQVSAEYVVTPTRVGIGPQYEDPVTTQSAFAKQTAGPPSLPVLPPPPPPPPAPPFVTGPHDATMSVPADGGWLYWHAIELRGPVVGTTQSTEFLQASRHVVLPPVVTQRLLRQSEFIVQLPPPDITCWLPGVGEQRAV
jgi:hypothetical protein